MIIATGIVCMGLYSFFRYSLLYSLYKRDTALVLEVLIFLPSDRARLAVSTVSRLHAKLS